MARWVVVAWMLAVAGCNARSPAQAPEAPVEPAPAPAPQPPEAPVDPDVAQTPAALYAACEGRVEGPEAEGECTADEDCARSGCSQEVCVPKAEAAGLMTPCDVQPCFAVLDQCGCVEGRCRWSLKGAGAED